MRSGPRPWSRGARAAWALHWVSAGAVAGLFALGYGREALTRSLIAVEEAALQAHVSIGAAVFALTLLRLCLRAVRPASSPERAPSGPGTRGAALGHAALGYAALGHAALYAGLIGAPVSGYVALAAAGFEVWAFDLASLPALPFDPVTAATALSAHKALAAGLGALIAGHAVVGIWRLRRGPGDG